MNKKETISSSYINEQGVRVELSKKNLQENLNISEQFADTSFLIQQIELPGGLYIEEGIFDMSDILNNKYYLTRLGEKKPINSYDLLRAGIIHKHTQYDDFKPQMIEDNSQNNYGDISKMFEQAHCGVVKPIIMAEIHDKAKYNDTGIASDQHELVFSTYIEHAEIIVLVTDTIIFSGDKSWIGTVREKSNKPIFVLDTFSHIHEIDEVRRLGADGIIILVGSIHKNLLMDLVNRARQLGMYIIAEVQNTEEVQLLNYIEYDAVGVNTREINNLSEVSHQKVSQVRQILGEDAIIIGESGIDNVSDLYQQKSGNCSGVIIGSSILSSRNIAGSIDYFKEQNSAIPYLWYRWGGKLRKNDSSIQKILNQNGFELIHSHSTSNSDATFMTLKKELFYKDPLVGYNFLKAIQQSLEITLKQVNTVDSELRFLKYHSPNTSLKEQYQILNKIKYEIRASENEIYGRIEEIDINVLIHTLHVPDFIDHDRDLEILSQRRNHQQTIATFLESQLSNG